MRGAGNARVVIADRLFRHVLDFIIRLVEASRDKTAQIVFNHFLVLGGRRHDIGVCYDAVIVNGVTMIKQPARRLCRGETRPEKKNSEKAFCF